MRHQLIALALLCSAQLQACAQNEPLTIRDRVGDTYEIRVESNSQSASDSGSSSSSSRNMIVERVVQVQDDGVELEFDLSSDTSDEDRAREWHFPARVFKAADGKLTLLNVEELEARLDIWLESGGIDRVHCGKWLFTWTVVQINCDPYSILETLEVFDLRLGDIREGVLLNEASAKTPSSLQAQAGSEVGIYIADFELDPDVLRLQLAETDMVLAEIMGDEPLTLAEAIEARSEVAFSGTLRTTIEIDPEGRVIKRIRLSNTEIEESDGSVERTTATETVTRRKTSAVVPDTAPR